MTQRKGVCLCETNVVRAGISSNRLCYKADFYSKPLYLQRSRSMTTQICHCSARDRPPRKISRFQFIRTHAHTSPSRAWNCHTAPDKTSARESGDEATPVPCLDCTGRYPPQRFQIENFMLIKTVLLPFSLNSDCICTKSNLHVSTERYTGSVSISSLTTAARIHRYRCTYL